MSTVSHIALHPAGKCQHNLRDLKRMKALIAKDPEALNRIQVCQVRSQVGHFCDGDQTPIQDAARHGHHRCIKFLIEAGAQLTIPNTNTSNNVLIQAIDSRDATTVKHIVNTGVFRQWHLPNTPLPKNYSTHAVRNDDIDTLQILIDTGRPLIDFPHDHTISFNVCEEAVTVSALAFYHSRALKVFLLNGAPIDHTKFKHLQLSPETIDCLSLIHHFAVFAYDQPEFAKEILDMLYELGANLWQKNRFGQTPLDVRTSGMDNWFQEWATRKISIYPYCYGTTDFIQISEQLKELMGKPRTLLSSCRVALLRHLGKNYLNAIKTFKLPTECIQFLNGNDLKTTVRFHRVMHKGCKYNTG
jgi:hypothetical protein